MALRNTHQSYGAIAKSLHWLSALLILIMLPLGFLMNTPPVYSLHKSIGLTILAITIVRVTWKLTNPSPKHENLPKLLQSLAHLTHWALYLSIFVMTFSGWLMSTASGHIPSFFGMFELAMPGITLNRELAGIAASFHETCAWVVVALISAHLLAVIYHQWIRKDNLLLKMLPRH